MKITCKTDLYEASGEFRVYEPGIYDMKVVGVEESRSTGFKTRGEIQWQVKCQIVAPEEDAGGTFSFWLYPESKAQFRVIALDKAIGIERVPDGDEVTIDWPDWIGRVVRVEINKEEWEGKERNKPTKFLRSDLDTGSSGAEIRRAELKQESGNAPVDVPF